MARQRVTTLHCLAWFDRVSTLVASTCSPARLSTRPSLSHSISSVTSVSKLNCYRSLLADISSPTTVHKRLRPDTLVVSVMHANNETGVLQPVLEIGERLAETRTLFHVDAAQTFGKEVDDLRRLRCDFLSISGHKIYGPKGIGALYIRQRAIQSKVLTPLMFGGGQEMGLRPGTLAVPLIVGLGEAAELARKEYRERRNQAATLRRDFLNALKTVEHQINGDLSRMQPHVVNIGFPGVDSEALMLAVRSDIAISNGEACTSSGHSPSHVLRSMGLTEDQLATAVRFSWGPGVTEIPHEALLEAVSTLKC